MTWEDLSNGQSIPRFLPRRLNGRWSFIVISIYLSGHLSTASIKVRSWKHFLYDWPFVRGIHQSPVVSFTKDQGYPPLKLPLMLAWMSSWTNSQMAGDLRHSHVHVTSLKWPMQLHPSCMPNLGILTLHYGWYCTQVTFTSSFEVILELIQNQINLFSWTKCSSRIST